MLWAFVTFYAISGNINAIVTIAKFITIFQVVVGAVSFLILTNDPDMQLYFGTPVEFAISIGIPTFVWAMLFLWAKTESEQRQNEQLVLAKNEIQVDASGFILRTPPFENSFDQKQRNKNAKPGARTEIDETFATVMINYPRAARVIEYKDAASEAWISVQSLSSEFQVKFLECMEGDPPPVSGKLSAALFFSISQVGGLGQ